MRLAIAITIGLFSLVAVPTASVAKPLIQQTSRCPTGESWSVAKHGCTCPTRYHFNATRGMCVR
jgi:hypothetical protein